MTDVNPATEHYELIRRLVEFDPESEARDDTWHQAAQWLDENEPEPPTSSVMSFAGRRTNAEAIRDLARMGILKPEDRTIDLTYGLGRFWTLWQPEDLLRADLDPARSHDFPGGLDAEYTGLPESSFDVVVVDPEYKLNGTANRGGPADGDADYGVGGEYVPWQERMAKMLRELTEANRLVKPKGKVVYKCQSQVCSGQVRWQEFDAHQHALGLKMLHRTTLYVEGYRAQPPGRTQKHAANNFSAMLVFEKGR